MTTKLATLGNAKNSRNMPGAFLLIVFSLLLIPALVPAQQQSFALNQAGLDNYVPIGWYENAGRESVFKQKMDLNLQNITIAEALNVIQGKSDIRLTYEYDQLPDDRFELVMKNVTIIEALENLFASTGLEALASPSGQVVVKQAVQIQSLEIQQETVTGVVRDESTGETMPGVNVLLAGTQRGTSTDANGEFQLIVPSLDEVLILSFIGYETQLVQLQGRSHLEIAMIPIVLVGQELVVVGYGSQRRQDLTGAISSVGTEAIERTISSTFDRALQGRAAGVTVTANSGRPGGSSTIRIRGTSSLTGDAEPLYVVDGIPISGGGGTGHSSPLAGINPNDIETLDILKDASATAIYGARAANGVIMITTKRGRAGETNVDYSGYFGFQSVPSRIDMMDLREYAEIRNYSVALGYDWVNRPEFADPSILGKGTDWQKELFRTTPMTDHNLAISGGDAITRYRLSLGYFGQEGIIPGSNFDRYSLRLNLDNNPTSWLQIGTTLNVSQTHESLITDERQGERIILSTALRMPPNVPYRNADGSFGGPTGEDASFGFNNPIAMAQMRDDDLARRQSFGNLYASIFLFDNLTLRSEFNVNYGNSARSQFTPTWQLGAISNDQSIGSRNTSQNIWWQSSTFLSHTQSFADKLVVSSTLGHEIEESNWEGTSASRRNFPSNEVRQLEAGDPATAQASSYAGSSALQSFFGRVNLRFDERYLLTATMRADASSKFAPENRWGYFPSVSLAWRVSNEQFFNVDPVSDLRLRAGYGMVGNQGIGDYLFGSILHTTATAWGVGIRPGRIPNPQLQWETTESVNLGLNLGMFEDRVNLTVDVYQKWTDNLLMTRQLPLYSGTSGTGALGAPTANIGALENKGFEAALNFMNMNRSLRWSTTLIYSMNRNQVTRLDQEGTFLERNVDVFGNVSRTIVGQPVGQFYGYKTDGLFQSEAEILAHANQHDAGIDYWQGVWIGDIRFVDVNGDGVIGPDDRTVIGDPNPKFTFGITQNLFYRNFDLSVFFNGSYGNDIFNYVRRWTDEGPGLGRGIASRMSGHARPVLINPDDPNADYYNIGHVRLENPDTDIPRLFSNNNNGRISDRYVEDGSYIRLKNLTLGYTLSSRLLSRANLRTMRVYFSGENLLTFTKYTGYDPEVGSDTRDPLLIGVDVGQYPSQRIFTLGLNFGF